MTAKPTKTRSELENMILAELRKYPECDNIDRVGITRSVARSWDFIALHEGPYLRPESRKRLDELSSKLRAQYDLAEQGQ